MIVTHLAGFSVIFTAKRQASGWLGCARVKPSQGAPEPFKDSPMYASNDIYRTETAAELGVQKEVTILMKKLAREHQAFSSLAAESGLRTFSSSDSLDIDAALDGLDD